MSATVLDCRGLPCPQPVLKCKQCLDQGLAGSLRVLVDNEPAKENVTRFLASQGLRVQAAAVDGGFALDATGNAASPAPAQAAPRAGESQVQIAVFITASTIGRGDETLGGKLMFNFLSTLPELGPELWRVVLVNSGVRLAVEGSPCLEKLQALEAAGASILVCGTCLEHFGLLERKRVGQTTNMLDVVTSLQLASKVIHV